MNCLLLLILLMRPAGAEIHEGMADNRYFDWELGDEAATEEALKSRVKGGQPDRPQ